ncbi:hypothetical protein PAPYR_6201 [Paratrimastix pyriformis]|uniref:Uncharacterized protein n=1 Tax=Paratrimastix pyriformis TaxID=342808 RepID=A0ABQ8UI38_9EUKA|nr:hypothetical protein PAPYR_6201 [Paratrimastix pyriformis]
MYSSGNVSIYFHEHPHPPVVCAVFVRPFLGRDVSVHLARGIAELFAQKYEAQLLAGKRSFSCGSFLKVLHEVFSETPKVLLQDLAAKFQRGMGLDLSASSLASVTSPHPAAWLQGPSPSHVFPSPLVRKGALSARASRSPRRTAGPGPRYGGGGGADGVLTTPGGGGGGGDMLRAVASFDSLQSDVSDTVRASGDGLMLRTSAATRRSTSPFAGGDGGWRSTSPSIPPAGTISPTAGRRSTSPTELTLRKSGTGASGEYPHMPPLPPRGDYLPGPETLLPPASPPTPSHLRHRHTGRPPSRVAHISTEIATLAPPPPPVADSLSLSRSRAGAPGGGAAFSAVDSLTQSQALRVVRGVGRRPPVPDVDGTPVDVQDGGGVRAASGSPTPPSSSPAQSTSPPPPPSPPPPLAAAATPPPLGSSSAPSRHHHHPGRAASPSPPRWPPLTPSTPPGEDAVMTETPPQTPPLPPLPTPPQVAPRSPDMDPGGSAYPGGIPATDPDMGMLVADGDEPPEMGAEPPWLAPGEGAAAGDVDISSGEEQTDGDEVDDEDEDEVEEEEMPSLVRIDEMRANAMSPLDAKIWTATATPNTGMGMGMVAGTPRTPGGSVSIPILAVATPRVVQATPRKETPRPTPLRPLPVPSVGPYPAARTPGTPEGGDTVIYGRGPLEDQRPVVGAPGRALLVHHLMGAGGDGDIPAKPMDCALAERLLETLRLACQTLSSVMGIEDTLVTAELVFRPRRGIATLPPSSGPPPPHQRISVPVPRHCLRIHLYRWHGTVLGVPMISGCGSLPLDLDETEEPAPAGGTKAIPELVVPTQTHFRDHIRGCDAVLGFLGTQHNPKCSIIKPSVATNGGTVDTAGNSGTIEMCDGGDSQPVFSPVPARIRPEKKPELPQYYTLSMYIRWKQREEYRGTILGDDPLPRPHSELFSSCLSSIQKRTGLSRCAIPEWGPLLSLRESDIDFACGFSQGCAIDTKPIKISQRHAGGYPFNRSDR